MYTEYSIVCGVVVHWRWTHLVQHAVPPDMQCGICYLVLFLVLLLDHGVWKSGHSEWNFRSKADYHSFLGICLWKILFRCFLVSVSCGS